MAEIFVLTRGHMDHVERWIRSMRSLWLPIKIKKKLKDENGKEYEIEQSVPIDVQLRPYQLWGIAIPDEQFLQPMCNTLGIPHEQTWFDSSYIDEKGEKHSNNDFISGIGIKLQTEALRLALKAQKLPEIDMTKGILTQPIYKDNISIVGIGWRPDEKIKTSTGEHEGI